jgi:hypothetical protein
MFYIPAFCIKEDSGSFKNDHSKSIMTITEDENLDEVEKAFAKGRTIIKLDNDWKKWGKKELVDISEQVVIIYAYFYGTYLDGDNREEGYAVEMTKYVLEEGHPAEYGYSKDEVLRLLYEKYHSIPN